MWLAKQQKRERAGSPAALGEVTLAGENTAVVLDSEHRKVGVCAPGGYSWRPRRGDEVLVIKSGDPGGGGGGGKPFIAGSPVRREMQPGEISLDSDGGARIFLNNQGGITLGEDVAVTGSLTVGGVELTQLIRSIVSQAVTPAEEAQ